MPTRHEIADVLEALGLGSGDVVLVHSALRALGPIEDGAGGLIETLRGCLGPDGLLAVPAFGPMGGRSP